MSLRATRYIPQCREGFPKIVEAIQSWPFESVIDWYEKRMPELTLAEKALLGANDRYFLLTQLLNRKDAIHPWIYSACREMEEEEDGILDLWARGHYKTTGGTFAGNIQRILADPEVRIGIFAATNKIAKPFLQWIMHEFQSNEELKEIYNDVLWKSPKREAPWWSIDGGIVVKREGSYKEPTLNAYGLIDGMPTGMHFTDLDYDDLVTVELAGNEEMVRKCTERMELSDNLGVVDGITRKRYKGTRYSFRDTYGQMIEKGQVKVRLKPATDDGTLDGRPVLLSEEAWAKKKLEQRSTIAAQMLQNPLAGSEATFIPQTLTPYTIRPRTMNVYIMGDPSQGIKSKKSDRTAIAVIGVDHNKNKFLLDGFCHRMQLSERWDSLKRLYTKWINATGVQFVQVGWERYGMQADLQYFNEKMEDEDEPSFPITELSWTREGDQSKKSRVQRLEPDFNQGAFYIPAKVWHPEAHWVDINGEHQLGPRTCLWSVGELNGKIEYRPIPLDSARGNVPRETRPEREARDRGEGFRVIEPIKRRDEDGNVYDLTRMFFDEFLFFPFSPHDDLIDAISRIYDMEPTPPMVVESGFFSTPEWD